jgi:hypothetical protein
LFDHILCTLNKAGKILPVEDEPFSWWDVSLAVVPCFNSQAPPLDHHSNTFTRRILVIVVGVTVLLTTNYYQAFILNGMMVQDVSVAYTVDELAEKLYTNELRAMFPAMKFGR